jgi:rRNA maturation endonuclease Nob1
MRKCINCVWEGDNVKSPWMFCPVCGDNTKEIVKSTPEVQIQTKETKMDLNKDGLFNRDDKKLAAKVLATGKRK